MWAARTLQGNSHANWQRLTGAWGLSGCRLHMKSSALSISSICFLLCCALLALLKKVCCWSSAICRQLPCFSRASRNTGTCRTQPLSFLLQNTTTLVKAKSGGNELGTSRVHPVQLHCKTRMLHAMWLQGCCLRYARQIIKAWISMLTARGLKPFYMQAAHGAVMKQLHVTPSSP